MGGTKRTIDNKDYIVLADAGADITGDPISILGVDRVAFEIVWTGTPTGVIEIQVSNSGDVWEPVNSVIAPAGAAGQGFVEVETAFKFARMFFDYTSGAGTLSCHLGAKSISA